MEKFKMALHYGADAVFMGGKMFNLRAGSNNFSDKELEEAVTYAHERGKRVYITLNIIPHNDELEALPEYVKFLEKVGVDGVIVADLGCVLYDGDNEFTIKRSKLRGVESLGMICAEDEIGVGTAHDGIIVLPEDAPVGQPASEYYQLDSDWLIDIDITANRADALSHYGVARDLYAWLIQNGYETSLHRPSCDAFKVDNHDLPIDVTIENTDACRRYACLSLTDCEVKESPQWLKDKLNIIGLRPINNIVDITNYIMMAYGQPMHCFDADMVKGHHIIVKDKNEGKKFVTLDGEEHILGEHDLAICNEEDPMCIAGVFGGKGRGVNDRGK